MDASIFKVRYSGDWPVVGVFQLYKCTGFCEWDMGYVFISGGIRKTLLAIKTGGRQGNPT
jgi:hypothetical protein